jgi:hypothetical protein
MKTLREILTPNSTIDQEPLILGLEIACKTFQGFYLDPGFFPILQHDGWPGVRNWFSHPHNPTEIQPYEHHPIISIPVHVNGCH